MRLVWSNLTKNELNAVRTYSLKSWGHDVAARFMSDIGDAAKELAKNPKISRPLRGELRLFRVRSHYLIVTLDDSKAALVIMRALHVNGDIERHLPT
jgi:plasmid stabilization system protein ParE